MVRSIPAHTGKPTRRLRIRRQTAVYPRTHGEAARGGVASVAKMGLSPHTRGSPGGANSARIRRRSIPAHTGKPIRTPVVTMTSAVYPRTHGEAWDQASSDDQATGLSPHTRGSQIWRPAGQVERGSIPAHTGKPLPRPVSVRPSRVYPRTHGEAQVPQGFDGAAQGLSPHTRGSRRDLPADAILGRSIPAHTGKPRGNRA